MLVRQACLLAATLAVVAAHGFKWQQLLPTGGAWPSERSGACIAFDAATRTLVLFGGEAGASRSGDTWLFNEASKTWEQVAASTAPPERAWAVCSNWAGGRNTSAVGPSFVIATGEANGRHLNDVWAFRLVTRSWRQLPSVGDVPDGRHGAVGGLHPGTSQLVVSHGSAAEPFADTYAYNLTSQRWSRIRGATQGGDLSVPHLRRRAAGTMASPQLLVLYGGCIQHGHGHTGSLCPAADGWMLNTSSGAWQQAAAGVMPARAHASMARVPGAPGYAIMYGGSEAEGQGIAGSIPPPETEVALLHATSGRWARLESVASARPGGGVPCWRSGAAITPAGLDRWYMFGGVLRDGRVTNELWVLSGNPFESPILDASPNLPFTYAHVHGLIMFVAWGVCLQAGWMIARYVQSKHSLWLHVHWALQAAGLAMACAGIMLVCVKSALTPAFAHAILGIIVMGLGLLQPLTGLLGRHVDSTRRRAWQVTHAVLGWAAMALAVVNMGLGVRLVAPPVGVWAAYFVYVGLLVVLVVPGLELMRWRAGRALQASDAAMLIEVGEIRGK